MLFAYLNWAKEEFKKKKKVARPKAYIYRDCSHVTVGQGYDFPNSCELLTGWWEAAQMPKWFCENSVFDNGCSPLKMPNDLIQIAASSVFCDCYINQHI